MEREALRIFGGTPARPDFYDRNPSKKRNSGFMSPGAATQVDTEAWSYTVPAGKKAIIELLFTEAYNMSATALNERAYANINCGGHVAARSQITEGQGAVYERETATPQMLLAAGESISGGTYSGNNAVGTDVRLSVAFQGTEFDA